MQDEREANDDVRSSQFTIIVAPHPAGVAARWRRQYADYWKGQGHLKMDPRVIYDRLVALGDTATKDQVVNIIGNESWTSVRCNSCAGYFERVVGLSQTGLGTDFEICLECLRQAIRAIEGDTTTTKEKRE